MAEERGFLASRDRRIMQSSRKRKDVMLEEKDIEEKKEEREKGRETEREREIQRERERERERERDRALERKRAFMCVCVCVRASKREKRERERESVGGGTDGRTDERRFQVEKQHKETGNQNILMGKTYR